MLSALLVRSRRPFSKCLMELREKKISATLVDAGAVYSRHHLEMAAELAEKSLADGTAVSSRIEMEFLLWLGQSAHVQAALERVGAKDGHEAWLVLLGEDTKEKDVEKLAEELGLESVEQKKNKKEKNPAINPRALVLFGVKDENALYEKMALCRIVN